MPTPTRPRTVLVTGAAKRLGRAIALTLAEGGIRILFDLQRAALGEARS